MHGVRTRRRSRDKLVVPARGDEARGPPHAGMIHRDKLGVPARGDERWTDIRRRETKERRDNAPLLFFTPNRGKPRKPGEAWTPKNERGTDARQASRKAEAEEKAGKRPCTQKKAKSRSETKNTAKERGKPRSRRKPGLEKRREGATQGTHAKKPRNERKRAKGPARGRRPRVGQRQKTARRGESEKRAESTGRHGKHEKWPRARTGPPPSNRGKTGSETTVQQGYVQVQRTRWKIGVKVRSV